MPFPSDAEVLIIGAGPTGLTLACELARRDVEVLVVEAAPVRAQTSRALVMHSRSLEVFADLGIADSVLELGVVGMGAQILSGERVVARIRLDDLDAPFPGFVVIPQIATETILERRLVELGGTIHRPYSLVRLGTETDRVTATVAGSGGAAQMVSAAWLVGCDGAHSAVRKYAGIGFTGIAYENEFLLADVRLDWRRQRDSTYIWLHQSGLFAAFPLPGQEHWRLFIDRGRADPAGSPPVDLDVFRTELTARTGDTTTQVLDAQWMSAFRINQRLADRYRAGRVFLAGDAAHVHSPFGGQGMNTGIQDAYNLGWKLAAVCQGADHGLLGTYEPERRPVARHVLTQTGRLTRGATMRNPVLKAIRNAIVPQLVRQDSIRHRLAYEASELNIRYADSSLVINGQLSSHRRHPRPGERAPDAPCLDAASGASTSLHECFAGTHFTVLGFAGDDAAAKLPLASAPTVENVHWWLVTEHPALDQTKECAVLVDPGRQAHDRYGILRSAEVVAIRPDGYVACRAGLENLHQVVAYLAAITPPTTDAGADLSGTHD